jgi:hypothetical protein
MTEDGKVHYLNIPIRFRPDARSQVELNSGAALDAVEAAQFYLDELMKLVLEDAGSSKQPGTRVPPGLLLDGIRELSWAKHYGYQSSLPVSRLFEEIVQDGSVFLERVDNLTDARVEMQQALHRVNALKEHLVTFWCVLTEMQNNYVHAGDNSDAEWKACRLKGYTEALQRWAIAAEKIETAIKSLTEASAIALWNPRS